MHTHTQDLAQRKVAEKENGSQAGTGKSMAPPAFQLQSNPATAPVQQKSSGTGTAMPSIVLKRKHIHLGQEDKYGHWWVELNKRQSYGWWPKYGVGLKDTLLGTEGELNGQTSFGGSANRDPHHGDPADEELGVECTDPTKTEADVTRDIISFAKGYSGEWRWTFGFGQNCHTFQKSMLAATSLKEV